MLAKIQQFFTEKLAVTPASDSQQSVQLAAAALLIELSRADFQQQEEEFAAIKKTLSDTFDVSRQDLDELIAMAKNESEKATSLHQFTQLIHQHYTPEQKFRLICAMWQVAYADGELSKYEDHMIRKVADLIYVPHSEFIRAKLSVKPA